MQDLRNLCTIGQIVITKHFFPFLMRYTRPIILAYEGGDEYMKQCFVYFLEAVAQLLFFARFLKLSCHLILCFHDFFSRLFAWSDIFSPAFHKIIRFRSTLQT